MKKKIFTTLLLALFCTTLTSALAAGTTIVSSDERLTELAYMDLSSANKSLQAQILQARNQIIYSKSWVADDVDGWITDSEGNNIEEVPHFSEVFPSDWGLPLVPEELLDEISIMPAVARDWEPVFEKEVTLKKASGTTATPFHSMATTTSRYYIKSINTTGYKSGGTYNVGYSNKSTGDEIGWKTNLGSGSGFKISPAKNITVSIRASTYTDPGVWTMAVDADRYDN